MLAYKTIILMLSLLIGILLLGLGKIRRGILEILVSLQLFIIVDRVLLLLN